MSSLFSRCASSFVIVFVKSQPKNCVHIKKKYKHNAQLAMGYLVVYHVEFLLLFARTRGTSKETFNESV